MVYFVGAGAGDPGGRERHLRQIRPRGGAAEGFRPFSRGRPLSQLRIGGSAAFKIFDNQKMTAAAQNEAGGA